MRKLQVFFVDSGRFIFVLLILLSAFSFAMFQGGLVSWTIFYAVLPFVCYSIALFIYPLNSLKVERIILTPRVENGENLKVNLSIKRKFRFPLLYTVVSEKWHNEDFLQSVGGGLKKIFVYGLRREIKLDYEIKDMPRGEHILEGVQIEVSDFFGWIRKTHFITAKNMILVYPKLTDLEYISMDTQYDRGAMVSPYNIVKDTTMATGVRDYQSGDRVSWIHWKSFARTQVLMTKDFEDRRSQKLLLIFDSRSSETFEEEIELTASILKEALTDQTELSFFTTDQDHTTFPVIQSEEQFDRVLVHLARIKPYGDATSKVSSDYRSSSQHGENTIIVTGSPDWLFLESVIGNRTSAKSVICFVVVKKEKHLQGAYENDIRMAESKGIKIYILTQEQFSTAFKEVKRF